jgi:hexosaminidase
MAMRSGAAGAGAAGMGVDADLGDNLAWVNRADGTIVDRNGHTIGRQGELWSQSVRGFNATTRTLFPATLGVVEQAWNERPMWSGPDYSRFAAAVAVREMPWLSALGLDVHLPPPGIYVENGLLIANSPIKGAEIRYTTDGSTPTRESTLWTEPVECNAYIITARLFYLGHESENSFFL